MQHFDSRDEYYDAVDDLLREAVEDPDEFAAGDVASETIVTYYGDPDLLTLGTCDPDLEDGWCPMSIIEHSAQDLEDAISAFAARSEHVDVSSGAYYLLRKDLETRALSVVAEAQEVSE